MKEFLKLLQSELPNQISEVTASFDLLRIVLAETEAEAQRAITEHTSTQRYEKIHGLVNLAKNLRSSVERLDTYLDLLDTGLAVEEPIIDDDAESIGEIIDYDKYIVNSTVPHSLYDDFKHIRPYAFRLSDGELHQVSTWKEMVVLLCQHLNKVKPGILDTFPTDKDMNGRKNAYFAFSPEGLREPRQLTESIFLHSNQSANALRNLMIKILQKFDIKPTAMNVYFRADYSDIPSRRQP